MEITHTSPDASPTGPAWMTWTGRVTTALVVLFLGFDGVMKVVKVAPVVETMTELGYPDRLSRGLGALELFCVAAYLWKRTSILGALLLTGFLGGAVSTHLRVGDPWASHTLFPIYVGVLAWAGLLLRSPRARALLPVL